jgi:ADP-heptose:LPS heptosyltransferase
MNASATTYIASIGGGLGDVVVAVPVIKALIARGRTVLVMRTSRQLGFDEVIPGLAGSIKEIDVSAEIRETTDRYINLRKHRLQTEYFWGGPEFERDYPHFQINDILLEICKDLEIEAEFGKPSPFNFTNRPELNKAIIFIPGTTVDSKTWSTANWVALKNRLEKRNFPVFMLGEPERAIVVQELLSHGVSIIPTPKLRDAIDILSNAQAVVSVDTGLMHIAVQQGTPTICLLQDPIYHRPYANAHALMSKKCASICVQNRMSSKPQAMVGFSKWSWSPAGFKACLVPEDQRCINSITVEDVLARLDKAIGK